MFNNLAMLRKVMSGVHEEVKPDILIPYDVQAEKLAGSSIALVYVRPETNRVDYEAAIVKALSRYARVAYMANLTGTLVNDRAIVASHYSSQMEFAINGREEMARYPEMVRRFEEKFRVNFDSANIVGPFTAIMECRLRLNADALFETVVPDEDFLEMYGQTVKRIDDFYVINYDIPAIITRHHSDTGMLVLAVALKSPEYRFSHLNYAIYDNLCHGETTVLLGSEKRRELRWYDLVRRTYHISRSHVEAMFDLTDFVFSGDRERLLFSATPLGRFLLEREIIPADRLERCLGLLKENPLVYLRGAGGGRELVNIMAQGRKKLEGELVEHSLEECGRIIEGIDWEYSLGENCATCGSGG